MQCGLKWRQSVETTCLIDVLFHPTTAISSMRNYFNEGMQIADKGQIISAQCFDVEADLMSGY